MSDDERVLAVRTERLFRRRILQGLEAGGEEFLSFILDPRNTSFIPRRAAESDPAWKQIIPYVLLRCGEELFVYRRGRTGGEARLAALHSIGVGGHIQSADESLFAAAGQAAYAAAVRREVAEEVKMPEGILIRQRIVGVINDDSVPVGRVHFGVIHLWELAAPQVTKRERQIAAARFRPVADLRGPRAPALETWSRLCLENWETLRAHPGVALAQAGEA